MSYNALNNTINFARPQRNPMLVSELVSITVTDANGNKYNMLKTIESDGCTDNVQHEVSKIIQEDWNDFCETNGEISYSWSYK